MASAAALGAVGRGFESLCSDFLYLELVQSRDYNILAQISCMESFLSLLWLYWNPERVLFTVPLVERPIVWYGVWFVLGFLVGYFLLIPMFARQLRQNSVVPSRELAAFLVDKLTWFIVLGTLVGARLGHVFFYDWPYYSQQPEEIYKVWKGGLASHGGVAGILIALFIYQRFIRRRFPELTLLRLMDLLVVPAAFGAGCIRIGNFFNQEILGTVTTLPWGVIFGDPADGSVPQPRHPVQLYEAIVYFILFLFLRRSWKLWGEHLPPGILCGFFLFVGFTARFFLEFFKIPQSVMLDGPFLQAGQYLSLPFIVGGLALLIHGYRSSSIPEIAPEKRGAPPVR